MKLRLVLLMLVVVASVCMESLQFIRGAFYGFPVGGHGSP